MARTEREQQDPTGQGSNRRSATRALNRRIQNIQQFSLRQFRNIPKKRFQRRDIQNLEVNRTFYEYDITATELATLRDDIARVSNEQLLESQDEPFIPIWFWSEEIEVPYRQGTIEETATINRLIDEAVAAGVVSTLLPPTRLQIEQILISEPYREALSKEINSSVASIKKLSADTSSQVFGVIDRGMQAGDSPRAIAKDIIERFDVSRSSAERIARTEVNKAYNDAKMTLGKLSSDELGVRAAVLHISALIPTTRPGHAARHGNTYTFEAQLSWWNSGSNRINCLCTTQTVLVDRKGQPVNKRFQGELKSEKKEFFDMD